MATTTKKVSREQKKFTTDDLLNAMEAVKCGKTVYSAAKQFNISKTTLQNRVSGKYGMDTRKRKKAKLIQRVREIFGNLVLYVSKIGFPITKTQLLDSVEHLVKELAIPNDFTNGRPGRVWFEGFMKRHPNVSSRVSQNSTKSRAVVTEANIRSWFTEVHDYLETENYRSMLLDPTRVFNCDESALFLCPKESAVLAEKGSKTVYSVVANGEKECLTTLFVGNAAGTLAPPMVVYKYKRMPAIVNENMPKGWATGISDSGWMTSLNI